MQQHGRGRRGRASVAPMDLSSARLLSVACLLLLTAACSVAGPDAGDAGVTVTAFTTALASGDGAEACALIAPATVESLEQDSGTGCATAVLGLGIATGTADLSARAYGRQAQVRTADDVVFLARSGDTWRITAAGCTPRGDRPYDCSLEGS